MRSQFESHFSEKEFKELYLTYYPVTLRVAVYILKEEQAAEDAVQEVFLKVWSNPSILSGVEHIKAYLILTTRNLCFDKLKKQKRESDHILQLELESQEPEQEGEKAFRDVLEEAVSKLPPKCRLIFSLSRFEGLSNDEIAEYLEISKRTVETQISLAFKAFRGELRPIFEPYFSSLGISFLAFLLNQL